MFSCKKDSDSPSPGNCAANADKVSAAATKFGNDPTKANCEAYKNSVSDFVKSCPTYYTGATKKALEDFMAEPCP